MGTVHGGKNGEIGCIVGQKRTDFPSVLPVDVYKRQVCQGAEPDWNHEEPGKTFADTMQDDISFCVCGSICFAGFFCFLKNLKKS